MSPSLENIVENLPSTITTAAYLIFCDGEHTVTMEKDYNTAVLRSSPDFIVVTNHDRSQEFKAGVPDPVHERSAGELAGIMDSMSRNGVIAESSSRKRCMTQSWRDFVETSKSSVGNAARKELPPQEIIPTWINTYPITNALTHYSVIMDARLGSIAWVKHYPNPRDLWLQLINERHIR